MAYTALMTFIMVKVTEHVPTGTQIADPGIHQPREGRRQQNCRRLSHRVSGMKYANAISEVNGDEKGSE